MGVALYYRSQTPIAPEARPGLFEAAQRDTEAFESWWCESFGLFEDDNEVHGSTKIFLAGYSDGSGDYREVDPDDDAIMAWRDTKRILELLRSYSVKYGIVWEINLEDTPFGTIDGSDANSATLEMADPLLMMAETDANDPGLPERIADIDRRHADRW
jgi:hypothetical protein